MNSYRLVAAAARRELLGSEAAPILRLDLSKPYGLNFCLEIFCGQNRRRRQIHHQSPNWIVHLCSTNHIVAPVAPVAPFTCSEQPSIGHVSPNLQTPEASSR